MSRLPGASKRRKRERLWIKQKGKCWWCKKKKMTVNPVYYMPNSGKNIPKNLATFEHLDSRLSENRGHQRAGEERIVLACYHCNWARGNAEVERAKRDKLPYVNGEITKAELRRRKKQVYEPEPIRIEETDKWPRDLRL